MRPPTATQKLRVNEIFYSLQGEGARKGSANIFVRFAVCNLTCGFCDTEFESYKEMTVDELLAECRRIPCTNIIFTGGEPLLQLTGPVIREFKKSGYYIAVETNGTVRPPKGLDWITLSPKVAEHVVAKNFRNVRVNELKYVRNGSQGIPRPSIKADLYFISPEFNGDNPVEDNLRHCIDLVKKNPLWRLSVQEHKLIGVR